MKSNASGGTTPRGSGNGFGVARAPRLALDVLEIVLNVIHRRRGKTELLEGLGPQGADLARVRCRPSASRATQRDRHRADEGPPNRDVLQRNARDGGNPIVCPNP